MAGSTISQASGPETGAPAAEMVLFDFISHENMHLPFNEEYLRTLRAAFPNDRIRFFAGAGHVANLNARAGDLEGIAFEACQTFSPPFGLSRHSVLGGRGAAFLCRRQIARALNGHTPRLVAILGVDASLYAIIGRHWPAISRSPLHMILHGQLGDAMVWRSRNPVARAFDIVSEVRHDLPDSVRLVALELGVKEAIAELAPFNLSVVTLEHPILTSEWSEASSPHNDRKVKIGFLGNARLSKGFEVFVNLANSAERDDIEFEAIGIAAPDTDHLDLKALSRAPSRKPLSRNDYLAFTRDLDLVCLPLHGRAYDFTASGTVADAVAALKPLLAFRSRTLDAIVARYGPIGWLVESEAELTYLVQTFDRAAFEAHRPSWIANLRKIRDARRPEALARSYRRLVTETPYAA